MNCTICFEQENGVKMDMKRYEYDTEIQKGPDINGAYVVFPYDIREEFGRGKVHVTFDGEPYDGRIVNMGVKNEDTS